MRKGDTLTRIAELKGDTSFSVKDCNVKDGGELDRGEGEERRVKRILKDTRWENLVRVARKWREWSGGRV
jgi:hypothetical protein